MFVDEVRTVSESLFDVALYPLLAIFLLVRYATDKHVPIIWMQGHMKRISLQTRMIAPKEYVFNILYPDSN